MRRVPLLCLTLVPLACDNGSAIDAQAPAADAALVPDGGQPADAAPDAAGQPDAAPDAGVPDQGVVGDAGFVPPAYDQWVKFEPPGAVCANGSPYKFFVNFSRTSTNAVIYFEGGGACWDYASCTGSGVRTAANRNGIPDNHARAYRDLGGISVGAEFIFPLMHWDARVSPMASWNKIFFPYCTGDVFSGDRTVTYQDPSGQGAPVEFHHRGHSNILRSIELLRTMFPSLSKMLVGGCSAGGAGAIVNYYFLRQGLNPGRGYLLDDSGPIFPDQEPTSRSLLLHNRVRESWNLEPLLDNGPDPQALSRDFGSLGRLLATAFPDDRLAITMFRLDYNYSLYSYERFYTVDTSSRTVQFGDGRGLGGLGLDEDVPRDRTAVYGLWWDDVALLRAQFDAQPNLGYFMPFYRETNSSHCSTIPGFGEFPPDQVVDIFLRDYPRLAWAGTEIGQGASAMNLRQYVEELLDDRAPIGRHYEEEGEGRFLACVPDPMYYNEATCEAAR